jgi:predicted RNase H-like HicB family nuclease
MRVMASGEMIFEVREDEGQTGYVARALGYSVFTQGKTLDELRHNVKEATDCHFDEAMDAPRIICAY